MRGVMLDTNIVSLLLKGDAVIAERLKALPPAEVSISAITEGELRYGLARRPEATRLRAQVTMFLNHVTVRPWTSEAAKAYGTLRARMKAAGYALAPLDMLIAAHALAEGVMLASNDRAFRHAEGLSVVEWR